MAIQKFVQFITEEEEGNAFTKALADAKKAGEKTFTVDGKEYDVETQEECVSEEEVDETNEAKGTMKVADDSLSNDAPSTKAKKFTDPHDKEGKMNDAKGKEVRTKIVSFKDFADKSKANDLANDLGKVSKDKDKTDKEGTAKEKADKEVQA